MVPKRIIVALVVFTLTTSSNADQPSISNLQIWTESDSFLVLHKHNAKSGDVSESFVRILEKHSGYLLSEFETAPFTTIVPIADGKYFAGLSPFLANATLHGYNFAVFGPDGRFVVKAFVLRGTDYCDEISQSVSQYVFWFDQRNPIIEVKLSGSEISEVIVKDSRSGKECNFLPGDFSQKWEPAW